MSKQDEFNEAVRAFKETLASHNQWLLYETPVHPAVISAALEELSEEFEEMEDPVLNEVSNSDEFFDYVVNGVRPT